MIMRNAGLACIALTVSGCAAIGETGPRGTMRDDEVLVTIGIDGPDMAACGSLGTLTMPLENEFASVRDKPSHDGRELDRIIHGTQLFVCDATQDARWVGIVYPQAGQTLSDCGVFSPVALPAPYGGDCRSGWIASKQLDMSAG